MTPSLKTLVRAVVTWPPLNRILTDLLRVLLPERVRQGATLARYALRVGVVEAQVPNGSVLRMCSRGDDDVAGPVFWRGWSGYEPETARPFYELACSARVTLDIGAHVGYFAILASCANPTGRIYAFEPMTRVRERLERNVALNRAANISCLPLAVGSPAGPAELFHINGGLLIPSSSSLSRSFMDTVVPGERLATSTVEVVEGDTFVDSQSLVGVDLIKIDTETTEAAVLKGLTRTLRRDRPHIICEVLDAGVADTIEALLRPLGYEFFLLTDAGPVPCDHITPSRRWRNFLFRAGGRGDEG